MATWAEAHRVANLAAAQAHYALDVNPSNPPIDVAAAIARDGVLLLWRPLPHMFGLYVNESGARPGILVNSALPRGARRHTAAHELGHHRLGHTTSVDDGSTVDATAEGDEDVQPNPSGLRPWPDQEKFAEAFASWFLMPRRAVASALDRLGLEKPATALDVYRTALQLGTSYRSTARHLPNLRLASMARAAQWMRVSPSSLKAQLDRGTERPLSRRPDVWLVDFRFDQCALELSQGDRIVVAEGKPVDLPPWLTLVPGQRDARAVLECNSGDETNFDLRVECTTAQTGTKPTSSWTVQLHVVRPPRGVDPLWHP